MKNRSFLIYFLPLAFVVPACREDTPLILSDPQKNQLLPENRQVTLKECDQMGRLARAGKDLVCSWQNGVRRFLIK